MAAFAGVRAEPSRVLCATGCPGGLTRRWSSTNGLDHQLIVFARKDDYLFGASADRAPQSAAVSAAGWEVDRRLSLCTADDQAGDHAEVVVAGDLLDEARPDLHLPLGRQAELVGRALDRALAGSVPILRV